MQRKIIAQGGGRIMVPDGEAETTAIDTEIVRFTGKKSPHLLFIPTASEDNEEYCQAIHKQYVERLGCTLDVLRLYSEQHELKSYRKRILAADIIYVGGGNTLRMMKFWRRVGIDQMLEAARRQGAVLCGTSAGAICWFRQGNSDSRKFADDSNLTLIKVRALDYVDALYCPHYDAEAHRQPALKTMMRKTPGIAIAVENNCAIQIEDDRYRIIQSQPGKKAWRVFWQGSKYFRQALEPSEEFHELSVLLDKQAEWP